MNACQRRFGNPIKHLRCRVLRNYLTTKRRFLLSSTLRLRYLTRFYVRIWKLIRILIGRLHFFIRASKTLIRLNVLIFWRFPASKCSFFVLTFYEIVLPNNGLWFLHVSQELGVCRARRSISQWSIPSHHKRWLWQCSGYSFVSKFLKEMKTIVIFIF